MIFSSRLFHGESLKGREARIIKKLKKHKLILGAYIICLAENGTDPLEYFDCKQLKQPYYDSDDDLHVCGLAADEEEAIDVIYEIVQASADGGYTSVRSYVEDMFT